MLEASESGLIVDPDRLEGQFEDFIGVYRRLVHHEICNAIISNFEKSSLLTGSNTTGSLPL